MSKKITAEKQRKNKTVGRPFQPGVSGNPKGRPKKGECITEVMREIGEVEDQYPRGSRERITRVYALCDKLWMMALRGNFKVAEYIINRLDGRPKESIEHTGNVDFASVITAAYELRKEKEAEKDSSDNLDGKLD